MYHLQVCIINMFSNQNVKLIISSDMHWMSTLLLQILSVINKCLPINSSLLWLILMKLRMFFNRFVILYITVIIPLS